MQEARQNWHKFRRLVGHTVPARNGLLVLTSGNLVVHGSLCSKDGRAERPFTDQGMNVAQTESSWEVLAHKYQATSGSFVDREALLGLLGELQKSKKGFSAQLKEIQQQILHPSGTRSRLIQHFGERPIEQAWPRAHFFLNIFRPFFSELLPEKKILLLVVKDPETKVPQTLALEFLGREMRGFLEPDWSGLELGTLDIFHRPSMQRLVLWCENHYLTPTFGVSVSSRVWEEAMSLSLRQSSRAAWRYLSKQRSQRENDCELLMEPEPWPLKACVQWLGFKS